jgi:hypothetical protein
MEIQRVGDLDHRLLIDQSQPSPKPGNISLPHISNDLTARISPPNSLSHSVLRSAWLILNQARASSSSWRALSTKEFQKMIASSFQRATDIDANPEPSPARLAANRANAQLSTGPKTDQGKAAVRLNAVKTGLTGQTVFLPSDDAALYQAQILAYEKQFNPSAPKNARSSNPSPTSAGVLIVSPASKWLS